MRASDGNIGLQPCARESRVTAVLSLLGARIWKLLSGLSFWQAACLGLGIFLVISRLQLADARSDYAREHKARIADRQSYERAQAQAKARNEATIKRVEHEQEAITDRVRSDYARDLDRLRRQAAQRPAGGAQASPDGKAPGGAGETDPVRLPPERLLRAQEIELRLKHLIDWVNRQSEVDPNR